MSEEIKELLEELKNDINIKENWQYVNDYYVEDMRNLLDYIEDLQQKVEQLENIRKEAIEYIDERFTYDEETGEYYLTHTFDRDNVFDLLNILNKGSEE